MTLSETPTSPRTVTADVLSREVWEPRAQAHAERADRATAGHRARADRGERHAVEDFLYDYYSLRPGHLRRWHPGIGVGLTDASQHASWPGYATTAGVTTVDTVAFLASRGRAIGFIRDLLARTRARPLHTGCFGLHEWAMVYRADEHHRRHPLPLRLGAEATDAVVEAHRIQCTHVDAFRFFTPEAVPLNRDQLTRDDQLTHEQPGCLHANMDLLKWALKLTPLVPGDLTLDGFDLALQIRTVDMQASPYDVTRYGLEPIAIETPDGKRRYAELQRDFSERANVLRAQLIAVCDEAAAADPGAGADDAG